jgi:hypothetical protein
LAPTNSRRPPPKPDPSYFMFFELAFDEGDKLVGGQRI